MARTIGLSLPISLKDSIEVCNYIRGKDVDEAKKLLENVTCEKQAVPMRRFNKDRGHKKGIGPGKYPKNVCKEILELLEGVAANAQFKGLNTSSMLVKHISVQKGATQWHYGRQRRRQMKRTHIELVVEEQKKEKKKDVKKISKSKAQVATKENVNKK